MHSSSASHTAHVAPDLAAAPMPCLSCGAPMSVGQATHLHNNPELSCAYCGRREPLPADAAERHRYLRLRLTQLERARATLEAPLAVYRALGASFLPALVFMTAVSAWQVYIGVSHTAPGQPLRLGALLPAAVVAGLLCGWLGMRAVFGRLIRPLLSARPASLPGLPARCRSCGGDLPAVSAAHVACGYCRADNLLQDVAAASLGHSLSSQIEADLARARLEKDDPNIYARPGRAFIVSGLAGALLAAGVLQVALWLFG